MKDKKLFLCVVLFFLVSGIYMKWATRHVNSNWNVDLEQGQFDEIRIHYFDSFYPTKILSPALVMDDPRILKDLSVELLEGKTYTEMKLSHVSFADLDFYLEFVGADTNLLFECGLNEERSLMVFSIMDHVGGWNGKKLVVKEEKVEEFLDKVKSHVPKKKGHE